MTSIRKLAYESGEQIVVEIQAPYGQSPEGSPQHGGSTDYKLFDVVKNIQLPGWYSDEDIKDLLSDDKYKKFKDGREYKFVVPARLIKKADISNGKEIFEFPNKQKALEFVDKLEDKWISKLIVTDNKVTVIQTASAYDDEIGKVTQLAQEMGAKKIAKRVKMNPLRKLAQKIKAKNMSYVRFENTYADLQDCSEHINDDDLEGSELEYRNSLVELCGEVKNDAMDIEESAENQEDPENYAFDRKFDR